MMPTIKTPHTKLKAMGSQAQAEDGSASLFFVFDYRIPIGYSIQTTLHTHVPTQDCKQSESKPDVVAKEKLKVPLKQMLQKLVNHLLQRGLQSTVS